MQGILITGPQGCGKTLLAPKLAEHYGKTEIINDWVPGTPIPDNAIALTSDCTLTIVDFEAALKAAGLLEEVTPQPRFCKDCQHFGGTPGRRGARCKSPQSIASDLVYGIGEFCYDERNYKSGHCGQDGTLFLAKSVNSLSDTV